MHDQKDLTDRGVTSLFVATREFVDGAEAQAKALGIEPVAVYVEHPIQDRTDAEMVEIAENAIEAVLAQIVESDWGQTVARGCSVTDCKGDPSHFCVRHFWRALTHSSHSFARDGTVPNGLAGGRDLGQLSITVVC